MFNQYINKNNVEFSEIKHLWKYTKVKLTFSFLYKTRTVYCRTHLVKRRRYPQGLQEKFCKVEQDCFGPMGQTETFLKIEELS
jgi:hypothetical protein